jgi:hypothetical protein
MNIANYQGSGHKLRPVIQVLAPSFSDIFATNSSRLALSFPGPMFVWEISAPWRNLMLVAMHLYPQ